MENKKIKDLGKLTLEEKKVYWKTSVSGSQAWMLIHEPYNLLRDKLELPRIHKSKYDFFNSEKFKEISTSAMASGTMYEKVVMEELKQHIPNEELIYEDHTYQLCFYDNNGVENTNLVITSTPDYYIKDEAGNFKVIGDIKCSTSASSSSIMMERYYYQALHNCYVLGRVKSFELDAKDSITKPLNRYQITFEDEDFDEYENKLLQFFINILFKNETAYDDLYRDNEAKKVEGKEIAIKPAMEYVAVKKELDTLKDLYNLKQQEKDIKENIAMIESKYKDNYDNLNVDCGDMLFIIKASETKGVVNYADALDVMSVKYKFPLSELEEYRKAPTLRKTISFKAKK